MVRQNFSLRLARPLFLAALLAFFFAELAFAGEPKENQEASDAADGAVSKPAKHDRVITGLLATTGRFSLGSAVSIPTVGSSPGDEHSVFRGSIVFVKDGLCRATVTNDGEDEYLVSIVAIGIDGYGKRVLSREASGKVKPGSTLVKDIPHCKKNYNLALELRSAKPTIKN